VPYEEKEFFGAERAIPYHINYELPVMFIPFLAPLFDACRRVYRVIPHTNIKLLVFSQLLHRLQYVSFQGTPCHMGTTDLSRMRRVRTVRTARTIGCLDVQGRWS